MTSRKVKTANEFFDLLDKLKNNTFVTIGYVTGANLNIPKVQRKNPATNRMKGYPDYSSFAREGYDAEIGALVKITSYNFRYFNREEVSKRYGEYKDKVNGIRARYAIDPIQDKESYKEKTAWSDRAPEVYKGQNAELQTHSYNPQNMFGANIKGVTYAVDTNGHIIRALDDDEVKPYLKAKSQDSGVTALRKMNAEEATIDSYLKEIQELKFRYMNFESNSILWMAATVDGEKIVVPVQTTVFNGRVTKSGVAQGKLFGFNCGATVMLFYPQEDGMNNTEFSGYMNRSGDSLTILVDINGDNSKLLIKINQALMG